MVVNSAMEDMVCHIVLHAIAFAAAMKNNALMNLSVVVDIEKLFDAG